MVVRYLPCLSIETEKHTYLILGTLVEESDSRVVGCLVGFGVPILLSVGYYFLADWMVNNGHNQIGYVAISIFLGFGIIGLIRSFFSD